MEQWVVKQPYLNLHCKLGEGPYYEKHRNQLRFVDIKGKRLHSVDLTKGPDSLQTTQFDIPVGYTADIEGVDASDKIIVGGKQGVYVLDRESGSLNLLKGLIDDVQNEKQAGRLRSNDGVVDPWGKLWFGSQTDFEYEPPQAEGENEIYSKDILNSNTTFYCIQTDSVTGKLYHVDSDLSLSPKIDSLKIPNGMGWSPDHKTVYFNNSSEKRILAFDASETGDLRNKRVHYQHRGDGEPDGLRIDVKGNIWSALHSEAKVIRVSPSGEVTGEITFPTPLITCPVFVGTELFVTSEDDEESEYGGGLFRVDVGVEGLDPFKFKLAQDIDI